MPISRSMPAPTSSSPDRRSSARKTMRPRLPPSGRSKSHRPADQPFSVAGAERRRISGGLRQADCDLSSRPGLRWSWKTRLFADTAPSAGQLPEQTPRLSCPLPRKILRASPPIGVGGSRFSTSCASTPSAPWRWMRCKRPTRVIRARRWRWRRWPTALWQQFLRYDPDGSDLAQPRPLRAVERPRLDAALAHAAPGRRQGGQPEYERSASRRDARRHQAVPPARQPMPRPSRNTAGPSASRPPPARSGRGCGNQRRHGDRRRAGWPRTSIAPASSCSTTTSTAIVRRRLT